MVINAKLGLRHIVELSDTGGRVEEAGLTDLSFGLRELTCKTLWICGLAGNSNLYATGLTQAKTSYGLKNCGASLRKLRKLIVIC